jgi:hypothetical protein
VKMRIGGADHGRWTVDDGPLPRPDSDRNAHASCLLHRQAASKCYGRMVGGRVEGWKNGRVEEWKGGSHS